MLDSKIIFNLVENLKSNKVVKLYNFVIIFLINEKSNLVTFKINVLNTKLMFIILVVLFINNI